MKLKEIFQEHQPINIYLVTDDDDDNVLQWEIEPTDYDVIPDQEGHFIVSAKHVYADKAVDCYVNLITPERICDIVIKLINGSVVTEDIFMQEGNVIPSVAADCYGNYELYYAVE